MAVIVVFLLFSDDWTYQRPSNLYYLGDLINIEASEGLQSWSPAGICGPLCGQSDARREGYADVLFD